LRSTLFPPIFKEEKRVMLPKSSCRIEWGKAIVICAAFRDKKKNRVPRHLTGEEKKECKGGFSAQKGRSHNLTEKGVDQSRGWPELTLYKIGRVSKWISKT